MSRVSIASGEQSPAGAPAAFGKRILALADRLAAWSETQDGLTCTFLSPAHRTVASEIAALIAAAGLDVAIDAAANVVGRYKSRNPLAKTVIVASHYDTVRDAGKYDGRLGILVGLVVAEHLAQKQISLPFDLELIAFSEEEGVRFSTSYIGSSAVAGRFDPTLLERRDSEDISLAEALRAAGHDPKAITSLARRRDELAGYLEVHIEQGPVLLTEKLSVGVVTEIAGNSRYLVTVEGEAGHAGTVPMGLRHDAAAAAAEIILMVERYCKQPELWAPLADLQFPTARSISFRVAANCRSTSGPGRTRAARRLSVIFSQILRALRPPAASRQPPPRFLMRRRCLAPRGCKRRSPPQSRARVLPCAGCRAAPGMMPSCSPV